MAPTVERTKSIAEPTCDALSDAESVNRDDLWWMISPDLM